MAGTTPQPAAGRADRPLSPHLQIYRWPVTMATSILHRVTGVATAVGLFLVTCFLLAAAMGPSFFDVAHDWLSSILGQIILFGFTLALSFHLANGIRHLVWDTGAGFDLKTARASGIFVFFAAVIITAVVWVAAYWFAGAIIS
jgi:succinate dehydrogenase / fumarate reductase cytochrome b subunit